MGDVTPGQDEAKQARMLAGRYRFKEPIGSGGMGDVWQAYDERLDRRVAVKLMRVEQSTVPRVGQEEALETRRQRFLREVRTTADLHDHPGVPAVYDAGVDEATGQLYVVMQLLVGREISTLISDTDYDYEPLPVAWAAAIGTQIASVLDEVHSRGVVHRDIKPANLMLTPGGVVKVLDFGVAALLGTGTNPHLTQEGMTVGTPAYISPEQCLANTVGPAADVYALACVLYELLTGRTPFVASDDRSHLWHHVTTDPPSVRALRPDTPKAIEQLLLAMLMKEGERRPTAAVVYEVLLPYAREGTPTDSPPLLAFDGRDLDPCRPIIRPFGGWTRHPRAETCDPAPACAEGRPLTNDEFDEVVDRAAKLAGRGQFAQAADLLGESLARGGNDTLVEDLTLSLAHVHYLGGTFREAAALFERVWAARDGRYDAADLTIQECRYYAAQCRMEIGESTAAISAFGSYVRWKPDMHDQRAIDLHLDALRRIMRLEAGAERFHQAQEAAVALRDALSRYRGPEDPELVEIDGFLARLRRLTD
ncbi:serine/threonine protein kinase [Nocardia tenerifensis]|uniref:non-specific serine/threonine protein kinase n=1 Tax=Nocardia tenerifensis TaxID=228006 RepID=A0A318KJE7_9NOCA|nr:serine/threonine-protein kinase [Nocardia tenerifensis]PXX68527.1 serine/threonine protein kinase [Nocardia tenerifensis]